MRKTRTAPMTRLSRSRIGAHPCATRYLAALAVEERGPVLDGRDALGGQQRTDRIPRGVAGARLNDVEHLGERSTDRLGSRPTRQLLGDLVDRRDRRRRVHRDHPVPDAPQGHGQPFLLRGQRRLGGTPVGDVPDGRDVDRAAVPGERAGGDLDRENRTVLALMPSGKNARVACRLQRLGGGLRGRQGFIPHEQQLGAAVAVERRGRVVRLEDPSAVILDQEQRVGFELEELPVGLFAFPQLPGPIEYRPLQLLAPRPQVLHVEPEQRGEQEPGGKHEPVGDRIMALKIGPAGEEGELQSAAGIRNLDLHRGRRSRRKVPDRVDRLQPSGPPGQQLLAGWRGEIIQVELEADGLRVSEHGPQNVRGPDERRAETDERRPSLGNARRFEDAGIRRCKEHDARRFGSHNGHEAGHHGRSGIARPLERGTSSGIGTPVDSDVRQPPLERLQIRHREVLITDRRRRRSPDQVLIDNAGPGKPLPSGRCFETDSVGMPDARDPHEQPDLRVILHERAREHGKPVMVERGHPEDKLPQRRRERE